VRNTVQRCLEFRSYVTGGMSGLLILVAFPLFGAAAYFYCAALDQARPWLPIQFRDNLSERFVVDRLIWERSFPAEARRNYLLSMVFGAAFLLCLGIFAYLQGIVVFAVYAAGLFLCSVAQALMRWRKYRDRL
jgi:hypothetical protein